MKPSSTFSRRNARPSPSRSVMTSVDHAKPGAPGTASASGFFRFNRLRGLIRRFSPKSQKTRQTRLWSPGCPSPLRRCRKQRPNPQVWRASVSPISRSAISAFSARYFGPAERSHCLRRSVSACLHSEYLHATGQKNFIYAATFFRGRPSNPSAAGHPLDLLCR